MPAPVARLKKTEIVWLSNHTCTTHGHTYLSHYNCYLKEQPNQQRLGFFDLECSNLDADWGIILSWSVLNDKTQDIESDVITKKDIEAGIEDKRIVQSFVEAITQYDKIVGFYSSRFDIPYARARAVINKVKFPSYGAITHQDLYFLLRNRFKLSSRRQENCCRVLLGKTNKTRIENKYWRNAVRGDKKSLEYVLDHNIKDVKDLRRLYHKTIEFGRRTDNSL